jgi:hypothetical protein
VKTRVWQRLDEILSGKDTSEKFSHLSAEDRTTVREILTDVCPEAPFRTAAAMKQSSETK